MSKTKKISVIAAVMLFAVLFFSGFSSYSQETIEIQVSPSVLNLNNSGEWVTIHTDIAYGLVVAAEVTLNDVPISWSKSDNQGNFVAKFEIGSIKALFEDSDLPGWFDLTLKGVTKDGTAFTGTRVIKVVQIEPAGKS